MKTKHSTLRKKAGGEGGTGVRAGSKLATHMAFFLVSVLKMAPWHHREGHCPMSLEQ